MIRIAICDDQAEITAKIETIIDTLADKELTTDVFGSGRELISYLEKNQTSFHIYLLDIEMPEINGIETARQIRTQDKNALILFVTDYEDYVYEVFEVLPFRFVRKPISPERLCKVVKDAVEHLKASGQLFFFQAGHNHYQVPYGEIIYFEGAGRKIMLHTLTSKYEFYGKISEIEKETDAAIFTRIHASYLLNMEYIHAVRPDCVELKGGVVLPVSKKYRKLIKQQHLSFMDRRCGQW